MNINSIKKVKSNKGSIVRVIISNFDDKKVKEIKALYSKHSGVDVIRLKDTEPDENGDMKFIFDYAYNRFEDEDTYVAEGSEKQSFIVTTSDNSTKLHFVKKNEATDTVLKEYTIQGKYETLKSGEVRVIVSINDIMEYDDGSANDFIREKRTLAQDTNRILLSTDTIDYYRQIASGNLDEVNNALEIDSQEIYKINKFLSYRSDMIIYFQMINNFLLYGSNTKEIYKYEDKNIDKDEILNICIENIIKNRSSLINIYGVGSENKEKVDEKINIDTAIVKQDLEKIILLFSKLRHVILHYDYTFWKSLYSGEDFILTFEKDNNKKVLMSELLDLNIFKELRKVKLVKDKATTNYLNKCRKGKYINFSKVMQIALNEKALNENKVYDIRNSIAHINMEEIYIEPLDLYLSVNNGKTISEKIEHIIERWGEKNVGKELNQNIINDYYMKKEELVLYLKLKGYNDVVSIDTQEESKRKENVLRKYRLENDTADITIKKVIEKIKELREASENLDEKDKQKKDTT